MLGSVINALSIVIGSLLGIFLKNKFSENIQQTVMKGISLAVILIGLQMALKTRDILIVIFSIVIGGVIGEIIDIEDGLNRFGETLKKRFNNDNDLFVQGFVQASLIYCVGAMAIMGAIQDGLNNDPTILLNKSILDGTSSIAFSATFGIGVAFSALPVLIYQGGISILASWVQNYLTEPIVNEMTATGGLLILAIGLNIAGATKIRVGNLLPALLVATIWAVIKF